MARASRVMTAGVGLAFAGLSLAHLGSCGDPSSSSPSTEDASNDTRPERIDASPDAAFVPPDPQDLPEGWTLYGDYDPTCGLYVPTDKKYLPPPIKWEPCKNPLGDAGVPDPPSMVCRHMVMDWQPEERGHQTTRWLPAAHVDGRLVVLLRRLVDKYVYDMVADVDGPVHNAILQVGRCLTLQSTLGGKHVLHRIMDDPTSDGPSAGGAVGGAIDQLRPRVYFSKGYQPSTFFSHVFIAGPNLFLEAYGGNRLYSFATGELVTNLFAQAGDESSVYALFKFHGDTLFFEADSSARTIVKVWTKDQGIQTLIGDSNDATRSTSSFGTDGVDMVWFEGSGRTDLSTKIYPVNETWTAKYSEDPAVVAATKRRVRSAYGYSNEYVVGCGYAAASIVPPSTWGKSGIRIIRLSDGVSWEIVDRSYEQKLEWSIDKPVALTCDELFALGGSLSFNHVARIRLDSLGPGIPAD